MMAAAAAAAAAGLGAWTRRPPRASPSPPPVLRVDGQPSLRPPWTCCWLAWQPLAALGRRTRPRSSRRWARGWEVGGGIGPAARGRWPGLVAPRGCEAGVRADQSGWGVTARRAMHGSLGVVVMGRSAVGGSGKRPGRGG